MAENKEKKRKKAQDYTRLLDLYGNRSTVNTADDANEEVTDLVENDGNVNNIAATLRAEQGQKFGRPYNIDRPGLAPLDSTAVPARSSTYGNNGRVPVGSQQERVIPRSPLDITGMRREYPDVPETSLPSFVDDSPRFPPVAPMLGGITNLPPIKELLATEEAPVDSRYENLITRATSTAKGAAPEYALGSPEARLAAAMAQTNPAPRSFWKRFGASLLRGASQVTGQDTPETMLGKIIGNVIPGLIPSVDRKVQYEENLARAERQYGRESAMEKSKQARTKAEQDIRESQERIKAGEFDRRIKADSTRILNDTRLDAATRQRAENIMLGLSKLPENDPQRDALAKLLADPPYGIPVGRNYGLLAKEEKQVTQEAKEAKPRSESDVARIAKTNTLARLDPKEKARSSTDARRDSIARDVRDQEFGGKVTTSNRDEYNKRVTAKYNQELASSEAYWTQRYNEEYAKEVDRLRSEDTNKQATTSRTSRRPVGSKRVPASNKAQATDYRGVTITLPGATRK